MADLIATPIGYQHDPQESANLNIASFAGVNCRMLFNQNDTNAGYLDMQIRSFSAIPAVGDTFTVVGQFTNAQVTAEVLAVQQQNEAIVSRSGGPVYILNCRTM